MMDRKEAAQYLEWMREDKTEKGSPMYYALTAGINALETVSSKPKTNGDRIRNMTDEELAEWLDLHGECNQCAYHPAQCKTECNEGHLKWLKQEVREDAGAD